MDVFDTFSGDSWEFFSYFYCFRFPKENLYLPYWQPHLTYSSYASIQVKAKVFVQKAPEILVFYYHCWSVPSIHSTDPRSS